MDISYKWNHTVCDPSCLASFTKYHVFQIHIIGSVGLSFLLPTSSKIWWFEFCITLFTFLNISSSSGNGTNKNIYPGDFPGSPEVKTSPSNAGGAGSVPGKGVKIPHALGHKNKT